MDQARKPWIPSARHRPALRRGRARSLRDGTLSAYRIGDEVFDYHHDITARPRSSFRDHRHPYYEIYLLLSGDVVAHVQDALYPLRPCDLILVNRYESHWFEFVSDAPYDRIKIQFKPEFVSDFLVAGNDLLGFLERRRLGQFNRVGADMIRKSRIDRIIRQMEADIRSESPDLSLLLQSQLVQLLIRLKGVFRVMHGNQPAGGFSDERIMGILEYLHAHAAERLTLDEMAAEFHMSKYHLCHLFKRCTGFTVLEYLTHRRIVRAMELLANGQPVTEVCYETGFADYSSFYRDFRKAVRLSPKQFTRLF